MSDPLRNHFLKRFEVIRGRMHAVQFATAVSMSLLACVAAIIVLAGIDYQFELSRNARIGLLFVLGGSIGLWLLVRAVSIRRAWSPPRTAIELERRFPQIRQRVRTTVQFGQNVSRPDRQGAAATLVAALQRDTSRTVEPIQIERAVPLPRLILSVIALAVVGLVLARSGSKHLEWRTALRRTVLDEVAYTTLQLNPGSRTVDEGATIEVSCDIKGRSRRVVLYSRPAADPDAEWTEDVLEESVAESVDETHRRYATYFSKISQPMQYRVQAGPVSSQLFRIDVRYPIEIAAIAVQVTPPEYTGLPPRTIHDGNVAALAGSRASFQMTLDRPVVSAEAVLISTRTSDPDEGSPRESRVPLQVDGNTLSMETELTEDFRWSVIARSSDGTSLPENIFQVRVHRDQQPTVTFVHPREQLLVHTLAEVLMKVRTSDDYGLRRSGIVFQVNNDEEHTLLQEDFAETAAAAGELEKTGRWSRRTRAVLEKRLPLEFFSLTPKDCVVYYAFAEDNCPGRPHRSESDLRFIDIRPFRATYPIPRAGDGGGGGGGDGRFTSLEELIRRQRDLLNRTVRLGKRINNWGDKELNSVDRLIDAQQEIADATRALADGLVDEGADDFDVLFQAEAAMLNAVDSLSIGKFDAARLQEQDAQQSLVEARNQIAELLSRSRNNAALLRALALLDRQLAGRLRGQQGDDAAARRLIDRLLRLADDERELHERLQDLVRRGPTADEDDRHDGQSVEPDNAKTQGEHSTRESDSDDEPVSRQEVESRQYDIVTEAQDIQRILNGLEDVTELMKNRIDSATRMANAASAALAAGDIHTAAGQTSEAAEMFGELARHLFAFTGSEAARRVASARDVATEIADRQRALADRLSSYTSGENRAEATRQRTTTSSKAPAVEKPKPGGDSHRAEPRRIAERARTLQDVLRSMVESTAVEGGGAAERVAELVAEQKLTATIKRTTQFPESQIAQSPSQVIVEASDLAERMEVAAAALERLYRSLVTPRIQQIRQLEEKAVALQERMTEVENRQMLGIWYRDARELLNDFEKARLGGSALADFEETINRPSGGGIADWKPAGSPENALRAPEVVRSSLRLLVEELQQQLQELVLTDLVGDRQQAAPPQYRQLIERYLKILSQDAPSDR